MAAPFPDCACRDAVLAPAWYRLFARSGSGGMVSECPTRPPMLPESPPKRGVTRRIVISGEGVLLFSSRSGEWRNGRRAGFRCQCPSGRGGSSPPPSPTESSSTNCDGRGHELERGRDLVLVCMVDACSILKRDLAKSWPCRREASRSRPNMGTRARSRGTHLRDETEKVRIEPPNVAVPEFVHGPPATASEFP